MGKRILVKNMGLLVVILVIVSLGYPVAVLYAEAPSTPGTTTPWIYATMAVLLIIFGGVMGSLFYLQRRFLNACIQDNQLAVFAQSPAGLPEGTVRAMIALVVVTLSLYLAVLLFFQVAGDNSKFPEVLSSLLGAVVGFYFGSRSGGKGEEGGLKTEVQQLKTERDTTQSETLLTKIKKGIDMSRAVIDILPEDQKKKYGDIISKLEQGAATVESLTTGGSIKDAVAKGQELFDLFKNQNPVKDIFTKSLGAFAALLGGTGPALAVIATVVGVGVKLVGSAYTKWKVRVLNVPLTPAVLPLKVVDANTGFTLLLQSPAFKAAFAKELNENDRPFMGRVTALLGQDDVEAFWNDYTARFSTREQFDTGLQEFRRAALDMELTGDTTDSPTLFTPAGGLTPFMQSVDRINTNEEAQACLHQLITIVEELQKKGEPVPTIFEKVQKEAGL
jgi:hypothetical protein